MINIIDNIVEDSCREHLAGPPDALKYMIEILREEIGKLKLSGNIKITKVTFDINSVYPNILTCWVYNKFINIHWSPKYPTYFVVESIGYIGSTLISFATGSEAIRECLVDLIMKIEDRRRYESEI